MGGKFNFPLGTGGRKAYVSPPFSHFDSLIDFMFGSFRKHQQWIWILGVIIIIPSFVIFFSPDAKWRGMGGGRQSKPDLGEFDGTPVERDDYYAGKKETVLNYFMRSGGREWPGSDAQTTRNLERDTIFRLFLIKRTKDLDIHVSDEAVARAAGERLAGYPPDRFEREYLAPQGLTLEDFERYIRHEAAIQQLIGVAAASAKVVSPAEAESLFRKQHEQVATEVAGFWATNYMAKVQATPDAISKYYSNNLARYRVPERMQVSYVEFSGSNFLAEADKQLSSRTNFDALIDETYFKRGGTNAFKDTNGVPLPEKAAKEKLRQDVRMEFALTSARRKAAEFGTKLMDQKQQTEQTFEKLAAAEGYPVKVTPPFSAAGGLENSDLPQAFAERALTLRRDNPILYSPIPGEHAVYVLALKGTVPSELPPLDKIRDKVTAEYKRSQALETARKEGQSFATAVTNGLAQKKTFDEIAKQMNVKAESLPPFSSITNSIPGLDERINFRSLEDLAFNLKAKQASSFVPNAEGGYVVYVKERLPVKDEELKSGLADFTAKLRMYRQNEAFNDWFRKEAEQARLKLPKSLTETAMTER